MLSTLALTAVVTASMLQAQPAKPPAATPAAPAPKAEPAQPAAKPAADGYVLNHKVKAIDGAEVDLNKYKGKVVLIVNVASRCGFTPQYKQLEDLHKAKSGQGLVVLGFPANNFGGQEPGSDEEIKKFCESKFNVTFPMFSKISVKGADQHALFKQLAAAKGEPKWNFTKYLIDREGKVVERFESSISPTSSEVTETIDKLLGPEAAKPEAKGESKGK